MADHVLVVVLLIVAPLWATMNYRHFVTRAQRGDARVREREYVRVMAVQWGLVGVMGIAWFAQGRSLVPAPPTGTRVLAGLAATAVLLGVLVAQWLAIQRMTPGQREPLRRQVERVQEFLPRTPREYQLFRWLSLTAGICEELLYRGFLLWYLTPRFGVPGAIVVGALAFGLGHTYQGRAGVLKTTVVGVFMGAAYYWSGTLLWPIILHVAIDLQGGALSYLLMREGQPEG